MNESRTNNSVKNILLNGSYQILSIILNFVVRTIFIKTLGEKFLGLNSLFTNILSVLSLAELGAGTAMVYSMYKPLASNDKEKLTELVCYYKSLYRRIALIIFIIGIILVPVLPYIVNVDIEIKKVQIYYILYLLNSVSSYLLLYKTSIIVADQKEYLVKKYEIIFLIIKILLQSIILILFKNYILYLIIQLLSTILLNLCKSREAVKRYDYIVDKKELPKSDKKEIWKNIKSLLYYQIANTMLNNTDSILISTILGTILVGYYSNYNMIILSVSGLCGLVFTSLQSSIGNYNVKSNKTGKYSLYKTLNFASFIIYGFFSIMFLILFQDFIKLWIGSRYILTNDILVVLVLNFYVCGILYPNWCFRFTTNLFHDAKYAMLICSILNIILSIILGIKFGLFGILLATVISRLCTTFWYEPYVLYKKIFKEKVRKYFLHQLFYVTLLTLIYIFIKQICDIIIIRSALLGLILKALCSSIIFILICFIIFRKTDEFIFLKERIIKFIKVRK